MLYEVIDEQEFISASDEKIITQNNVENEQLKDQNEQLKVEENEQLRKITQRRMLQIRNQHKKTNGNKKF